MSDQALELRWYVTREDCPQYGYDDGMVVSKEVRTLQWQTVEKMPIPSKGEGLNYAFMESGWSDIPVVYEEENNE